MLRYLAHRVKVSDPRLHSGVPRELTGAKGSAHGQDEGNAASRRRRASAQSGQAGAQGGTCPSQRTRARSQGRESPTEPGRPRAKHRSGPRRRHPVRPRPPQRPPPLPSRLLVRRERRLVHVAPRHSTANADASNPKWSRLRRHPSTWTDRPLPHEAAVTSWWTSCTSTRRPVQP
jgi:hypothetical protein